MRRTCGGRRARGEPARMPPQRRRREGSRQAAGGASRRAGMGARARRGARVARRLCARRGRAACGAAACTHHVCKAEARVEKAPQQLAHEQPEVARRAPALLLVSRLQLRQRAERAPLAHALPPRHAVAVELAALQQLLQPRRAHRPVLPLVCVDVEEVGRGAGLVAERKRKVRNLGAA